MLPHRNKENEYRNLFYAFWEDNKNNYIININYDNFITNVCMVHVLHFE